MEYDTPIIKLNEVPNILFIGNGINRTSGCDSWDDMIGKIMLENKNFDKDILNKLPYPFQPILATHDNIDNSLNCIADELISAKAKESQAQLIRKFTDLGFDAILTTNYTYEIEKTIDPQFYCKKSSRSKYRRILLNGKSNDNQFGLFKCMQVNDEKNCYRIWHVHGESALPKSMIIGYYYYGKLLYRIQDRVADCIKEYKMSLSKGLDFHPKSWIDYFLLGNIYMVGFGLDFSESDIWWLINCKKRNDKDNSGKIYFYDLPIGKCENISKNMLLECLDVEVNPDLTINKNMTYNDFYIAVARIINKNICKGRIV